jgi:excinuclease UvrABC nuclease subunit
MLPENISCNSLKVATLADRRELPECPAIYFVLEKDTVVYIGQTVNLRQRISGHHRLPEWKVRDDIQIRWLPCNNAATLPQLEKHLIDMVQPEMNGKSCRGQVGSDESTSAVRISITFSDEEYEFLAEEAARKERTLAAQMRYWVKEKMRQAKE